MITCVFENGAPAALRHVVVHAVIERDGALLLVRRVVGERDDESTAVEWIPIDQLPDLDSLAFDHGETEWDMNLSASGSRGARCSD